MATLGRYELIRRVGMGATAEVWKARIKGPAGFEKYIAIKKILPHLVEQDFINVFAQEAKLVARLVHPNIVQVLDFGEAPSPDEEEGLAYYIAMEYVSGQNLNAVLSRLRKNERMFPLEIGLYIITEVAKALSHAHGGVEEDGKKLSVVHRDVSPHNVLLSYDGEVKVTDFGVAKVTSTLGHTTGGVLKGKLRYMSPEQAEMAPLDGRSDLFCLGIILYEFVVGHRLFRGSSPEEIHAQITAFGGVTSEDLEKVPAEVRPILKKVLQPQMADRYADAADLEVDLAALVGLRSAIETRRNLSGLLRALFAREYQVEIGGSPEEDTEVVVLARNEELSNSLSSLPFRPRVDQDDVSAEFDRDSAEMSMKTGISEPEEDSTSYAFRGGRKEIVNPGRAGGEEGGTRISETDREPAPDRVAKAKEYKQQAAAREARLEQSVFEHRADSESVSWRTIGAVAAGVGVLAVVALILLPRLFAPGSEVGVTQGQLSVISDQVLEVIVDDRNVGQTPIEGYPLDPGTHTLRFIHQGTRFGSRRSIEIRAGQHVRLDVDVAQRKMKITQ